MIPLFAIKWIAGASILLGAIALIYNQGYRSGYAEVEQKYTKLLQVQQDLIHTKISNLETLASTLVEQEHLNSLKIAKDVQTVISKIKGKPLTIIRNDGCVPSQVFVDTFNEVNKKVNKGIQP